MCTTNEAEQPLAKSKKTACGRVDLFSALTPYDTPSSQSSGSSTPLGRRTHSSSCYSWLACWWHSVPAKKVHRDSSYQLAGAAPAIARSERSHEKERSLRQSSLRAAAALACHPSLDSTTTSPTSHFCGCTTTTKNRPPRSARTRTTCVAVLAAGLLRLACAARVRACCLQLLLLSVETPSCRPPMRAGLMPRCCHCHPCFGAPPGTAAAFF